MCMERNLKVVYREKLKLIHKEKQRVEEMALDRVILILPSQLFTCLCLACRAACVSGSPPSRYKIISL